MNILLGVSASIAIYRSCELVRLAKKAGYSVRVVMTRMAESWISPTIFSALSENQVYTNHDYQSMPHIDIRKDLDLFLVAPATANVIAKAAHGIADDILTATLLSFTGERWFAPAMNPNMYSHQLVQKNIAILREVGYSILEPISGEAVCGDLGEGKMMGIEDIFARIRKYKKQIP